MGQFSVAGGQRRRPLRQVGRETSRCLDLDPLVDGIDTPVSGACLVPDRTGADLARPTSGRVSPTGVWVVVHDGKVWWVSSLSSPGADWNPARIGLPDNAKPLFWDGLDTFVAVHFLRQDQAQGPVCRRVPPVLG